LAFKFDIAARFPYPLELIPQPLYIQQTRSAHSITAQYVVLCDGLTEGHFFQLCCGCGYQRCCTTAGWQL